MFPWRKENSLTVDVVVAVTVMLIMTVIAYWLAEVPQDEAASEFEQGFRLGFLGAGAARGVISAVCCLLIYLRVRWWFALLMTVVVVSIAGVQVAQHLGESDLFAFALSLLICATVMPASWAEYFLTFRVYRKWRRVQTESTNRTPI